MQQKYIQKLIDICGRANISRNIPFNHLFIVLEPFENSAAALRGLWQPSHYSWIGRRQCYLYDPDDGRRTGTNILSDPLLACQGQITCAALKCRFENGQIMQDWFWSLRFPTHSSSAGHLLFYCCWFDWWLAGLGLVVPWSVWDSQSSQLRPRLWCYVSHQPPNSCLMLRQPPIFTLISKTFPNSWNLAVCHLRDRVASSNANFMWFLRWEMKKGHFWSWEE